MTDHARMQVREAAKTLLTGLATTGANVFTARVSPLTDDELPALKVMLRDETADWDAMGKLVRTGRLVIEGWAQGGDGLEDKLDLIAAEVEAKIYQDGGALDALLQNIGAPTTSIDLPETPAGGARRTGVVRMLFPVMYRTAETNPTSIV